MSDGLWDLGVDDGEQLLPPWISLDDVVVAFVCFLPLRSVDVTSVTYVFVFVSQLFGLGVDDGEQLLPPRISVVVFVTSFVCFWPLRSVDVSCVTVVRVFVSQLFPGGGG